MICNMVCMCCYGFYGEENCSIVCICYVICYVRRFVLYDTVLDMCSVHWLSLVFMYFQL